MTYTKKSEILDTQTATSVGSAGNTTSVPGWVDVVGSEWNIDATEKSVVHATTGEGKDLRNVYLNAHAGDAGEGNQRIVFEIPIGTASLPRSIWFRRTFTEPTSGIHCYIPLGSQVYWAHSLPYAGETTQSGGNLNLNNAKRYRVTITVSGTIAGGGITCTVQVYNVTDAAPHIWSSGTDTRTITLLSNAPESGTIVLKNDAAGANYGLPLQIYTEGEAGLVGVTQVTVPSETGVSVMLSPVGGVAPMTVTLKRAGNHLTGSPATYIDTPLVFSDSGLTNGTTHLLTVEVDDSLAQEYTTAWAFATTLPGWPRTMRLMGIGDSITLGGSPRPTETAMALLANFLGVTDSDDYDEVAFGGYGYTTEEADAEDAVDVANGDLAGTNGGTLNGPADLIVIRYGKNDHSAAPSETAASIQLLIDAIRDGCPNDPTIIILPITGDGGSGSGVSYFAERQYLANIAFRSLENTANGVYVADLSDYFLFTANPSYLPDFIHPQQAQMVLLAHTIFKTYVNRVVLSGRSEWGTNGSSLAYQWIDANGDDIAGATSPIYNWTADSGDPPRLRVTADGQSRVFTVDNPIVVT